MINEALRLMRIYHDLSQTELSNELAMSNSYLSEIESGKKQPTLEILEKYASLFQVPVSSLMFFSEQLGNENPGAKKLRDAVSRKVISLLNWVAEKDGVQSRTGNKAA